MAAVSAAEGGVAKVPGVAAADTSPADCAGEGF